MRGFETGRSTGKMTQKPRRRRPDRMFTGGHGLHVVETFQMGCGALVGRESDLVIGVKKHE
jgi:hypothetical protein